MAHAPRKLLNFLSMSTQGDLGALTLYTSQRQKLVIFPRAPPLMPPSLEQSLQRQKFVTASIGWNTLTSAEKLRWKRAVSIANLRITGYNLWCYWSLTNDQQTIATIERQTGISLLPA